MRITMVALLACPAFLCNTHSFYTSLLCISGQCIAGFAAMGILDGIVWIATTLSALPGSAVETPWISAWMIAGYYGILVLILLMPTLHRFRLRSLRPTT